MWNHFQVDSLHAYGDYDEASMFRMLPEKWWKASIATT